MNQDEEQLRPLSIFYSVCAGLAAFFACIPIIHLIVFILIRPSVKALFDIAPPSFAK